VETALAYQLLPDDDRDSDGKMGFL
jgi:hypothetical protein